MLSAGYVFAHRDWAPGRKTDIDEASLEADRDWAPGAAPEEDDMIDPAEWQQARQALARIDARTAHLDGPGIAAIARIDAALRAQSTANLGGLVREALAEIKAAGVEDGKRDAALLTVLAGFKPFDPPALAAALAPLLRDEGVQLDEATLLRAARLDIASRLTDPAAEPAA